MAGCPTQTSPWGRGPSIQAKGAASCEIKSMNGDQQQVKRLTYHRGAVRNHEKAFDTFEKWS